MAIPMAIGAGLFALGKSSAPSPGQPTTPPKAPTPGIAARSAEPQLDAIRSRRGLLANIFAGQTNTQPVTGKTQLGT